MALSDRQKITPVPPELQPYYDGNKGRPWLGWVIRTIVVVAIIVLLILGIIWLVHRHDTPSKTDKATKSANTAQAQSKKPTPHPSTASTPTAGSDTPTSNATASNSTSEAPAANVPAGPQASAIPNTGPGDTLGLFLGVVIAGIGIYQLRLRAKLLN